jgi:hypothetical protein
VKPQIIEDCTTHVGYVDLSDRMADSGSISKKTWKWTGKLFFHSSTRLVGGNVNHLKFREQPVRDLVLSH